MADYSYAQERDSCRDQAPSGGSYTTECPV